MCTCDGGALVELDQGGRLARRVGVRSMPEASGFVESSFVLQTEDDLSQSWRIVPDTSAHVLLHFRSAPSGPVLKRARVSGARTRFGTVSVRDRAFSVGVRLTPGALQSLTGLSGRVLLDRSVDLGELWKDEAAQLVEVVNEDPRPEQVRRALLSFMKSISQDRAQPDWRVRGFASALRRERVSGLDATIARMGLAPRTLRRACRQVVGLTPKQMARIHRLYRCLTIGIADPGCGGARLALRAGYSDQPHMIRECRAFLGETPRQFLSRGEVGPGRFVQ